MGLPSIGMENGRGFTNQRECFMLVLTRKHQEKIRIGNDITITILRTKGKAVRVGVEAPADIPVIRGELSFRSQHDSPQASAEVEVAPNVVPAALVHRSRPRLHDVRDRTNWAKNSHPAGEVSLQRVPREKVTALLPQLAG